MQRIFWRKGQRLWSSLNWAVCFNTTHGHLYVNARVFKQTFACFILNNCLGLKPFSQNNSQIWKCHTVLTKPGTLLTQPLVSICSALKPTRFIYLFILMYSIYRSALKYSLSSACHIQITFSAGQISRYLHKHNMMLFEKHLNHVNC